MSEESKMLRQQFDTLTMEVGAERAAAATEIDVRESAEATAREGAGVRNENPMQQASARQQVHKVMESGLLQSDRHPASHVASSYTSTQA